MSEKVENERKCRKLAKMTYVEVCRYERMRLSVGN